VPQCDDFPDLDATIQDQALTWWFDGLLATGDSLLGQTPVITVTDVSVPPVDASPQSRITSPQITQAPGKLPNCSVSALINNAVAGARYLFVVKCPTAVYGVQPSQWNHMRVVSPQ